MFCTRGASRGKWLTRLSNTFEQVVASAGFSAGPLLLHGSVSSRPSINKNPVPVLCSRLLRSSPSSSRVYHYHTITTCADYDRS